MSESRACSSFKESEVYAKRDMAGRLREVRAKLCGEHGHPTLARLLSLSQRVFASFKNNIMLPGEARPAFVPVTIAEPQRLRHGGGRSWRRF